MPGAGARASDDSDIMEEGTRRSMHAEVQRMKDYAAAYGAQAAQRVWLSPGALARQKEAASRPSPGTYRRMRGAHIADLTNAEKIVSRLQSRLELIHKLIPDLPVDTTLIHGHGKLATPNNEHLDSGSAHRTLNASAAPSPVDLDLSEIPHGYSDESLPLTPSIPNITIPYVDTGILQSNVDPYISPAVLHSERYIGYIDRFAMPPGSAHVYKNAPTLVRVTDSPLLARQQQRQLELATRYDTYHLLGLQQLEEARQRRKRQKVLLHERHLVQKEELQLQHWLEQQRDQQGETPGEWGLLPEQLLLQEQLDDEQRARWEYEASDSPPPTPPAAQPTSAPSSSQSAARRAALPVSSTATAGKSRALSFSQLPDETRNAPPPSSADSTPPPLLRPLSDSRLSDSSRSTPPYGTPSCEHLPSPRPYQPIRLETHMAKPKPFEKSPTPPLFSIYHPKFWENFPSTPSHTRTIRDMTDGTDNPKSSAALAKVQAARALLLPYRKRSDGDLWFVGAKSNFTTGYTDTAYVWAEAGAEPVVLCPQQPQRQHEHGPVPKRGQLQQQQTSEVQLNHLLQNQVLQAQMLHNDIAKNLVSNPPPLVKKLQAKQAARPWQQQPPHIRQMQQRNRQQQHYQQQQLLLQQQLQQKQLQSVEGVASPRRKPAIPPLLLKPQAFTAKKTTAIDQTDTTFKRHPSTVVSASPYVRTSNTGAQVGAHNTMAYPPYSNRAPRNVASHTTHTARYDVPVHVVSSLLKQMPVVGDGLSHRERFQAGCTALAAEQDAVWKRRASDQQASWC